MNRGATSSLAVTRGRNEMPGGSINVFASAEKLASLFSEGGSDDESYEYPGCPQLKTPSRAIGRSPPVSPLKSPGAASSHLSGCRSSSPASSASSASSLRAPSSSLLLGRPQTSVRGGAAAAAAASPVQNTRQADRARPHTCAGEALLASSNGGLASTAARALPQAPSGRVDLWQASTNRSSSWPNQNPWGPPVTASPAQHPNTAPPPAVVAAAQPIAVQQGGFGAAPALRERPATGGPLLVRNLDPHPEYAADSLDHQMYAQQRPGQEMWRMQGKESGWAEQHRQDRLRRRDEEIGVWHQELGGQVEGMFDLADEHEVALAAKRTGLHRDWTRRVFDPINAQVAAQVDALPARELSRRLQDQAEVFIQATNRRKGYIFRDSMDASEAQAIMAARKSTVRYRAPLATADPLHRCTERLAEERREEVGLREASGDHAGAVALRQSFALPGGNAPGFGGLGRPANRLAPSTWAEQKRDRGLRQQGLTAQRSSPGVLQDHYDTSPVGAPTMRREHLAAVPGHSKGVARVGPDAAARQASRGARMAGNPRTRRR